MNDDDNDWKFLYDFSSPNRNEGDTICLGMNDMEETIYESIDQISTCTLHNGREVQVAEGLMYGLGYQSYPFFFPNYMWVMINAYVPIYDPINFYRNGELLWGVPYDMHSKLAANEQDLDVDGKKWHIRTQVPYIDDRYTNDVFMWIEGDTIVEDIRYKKLYKQTRNVKDSSMGTIEVGYCRQEGDKYYQDGKLMFDFGLGVGDMFATSTDNEEAGFFYTVVSIGDTLLLDGLPRKYMVIAPSYEGMIKANHTDIWIEGIGSLSMGIFENDFYYMDGLKKELQCCSYNDIYIYKKKEESKTYLVTEGKEWAVCSHGFMPPPNHSTYTYRLQGDTIIDGKRYLKEHVSHDIHLANWKPSGRYLREENGKVYSKFKQKNEQIQLDYNMNVGDTLRYNDHTDNYRDYVYICLTGIRDTIMPNGDGVSRRCYDVDAGQYIEGTYHPCEHQTSFVEGIGWIDWGLGKQLLLTDGGWDELLYVKQGNNLLYQKEKGVWWVGDNVDHRPLKQRGYGLYHSDSYLYAYTINEAEAVTDSTDFARWYDKTVIYFDVDTIGPNAFSGATFRQGQILYFTERLNTIFKDAFTDINIIKRTSQESLMSDDLTLVFAGANPPGIDKNHIMDYADSTYHINYVVPDLAAYIEDDIQWTYTTLMTIDDFVQGYVSPENEVTVNDSTETDVNMQPGTNQDGNIDLVVHARPRKEIPVRIGEGENKDIYSRAPAWMRYTMELRITDSEGTELYTGEMQCSAYGECQFNVSFACPANKIIHIYSRSIDMFGRATEWAITTINLDTSISPTVAPNTDAPYYDLQGRPVANPTRGIYIRNGKKVIL